jgi:hypothetical protein
MRNSAMADAFYRTNSGAVLVFQARRAISVDHREEAERKAKEIAMRIRQLKELVYATFVSQVPPTCRTPRSVLYSIYQDAKPVIRELGVKGGQEYSKALNDVKFTWSNDQSCRSVVGLLTGK